jgi:prevent-host-death family protein
MIVKAKGRSLYPEAESEPLFLNEMVPVPGLGVTIPIRAAKAKLSALLEFVASGTPVTITSHGQAKAVLSPVDYNSEKLVGFEPAWDLLKAAPMQTEGPFAEDIIREDRDGHRG